jgi:hypothetical protein
MDPIESYFARFPQFRYKDSTKDWRQIQRFNALAKRLKWSKEERNTEFQILKEAWTGAVESEFEGVSILHYRALCQDLDIDPVPETVTECKHELSKVFVNIVDLMEYRRKGRRRRKPKQFADLEELREYSHDTKKYYPKENAKAEMLRVLLKVLFY